MSDDEFDRQAQQIAEQIRALPAGHRVAAACRGSGNPAALSWLAESLCIDETTAVIDLGAGLGGPSAWLHQRFGCRCIDLELAAGAAMAHLFGTPTIRGCTEQLPVRNDAVDVAVLLGVLSVVDHPSLALSEALRIARRLGVIDYCSTTGEPVRAGGSTFVTRAGVHEQVAAAGWHIGAMITVAVPSPLTWTAAAESIDVAPGASEAEVIDAIQRGRLEPFALHATR